MIVCDGGVVMMILVEKGNKSVYACLVDEVLFLKVHDLNANKTQKS